MFETLEANIIKLRDAARSLAEETQHIHDSKIRERTITLCLAIEESDRLIPPVGLCTTLLPAAAIARKAMQDWDSRQDGIDRLAD